MEDERLKSDGSLFIEQSYAEQLPRLREVRLGCGWHCCNFLYAYYNGFHGSHYKT